MATFPDIAPSQSTTYEQQFKVIRNNFGDSYTQRSADGLNNKPRSLNMSWELKPVADIEAIKAFLDARAGVEVFEYTPVGESVELKWTAGKYNETPNNKLYSTITTVFTQEFDL